MSDEGDNSHAAAAVGRRPSTMEIDGERTHRTSVETKVHGLHRQGGKSHKTRRTSGYYSDSSESGKSDDVDHRMLGDRKVSEGYDHTDMGNMPRRKVVLNEENSDLEYADAYDEHGLANTTRYSHYYNKTPHSVRRTPQSARRLSRRGDGVSMSNAFDGETDNRRLPIGEYTVESGLEYYDETPHSVRRLSRRGDSEAVRNTFNCKTYSNRPLIGEDTGERSRGVGKQTRSWVDYSPEPRGRYDYDRRGDEKSQTRIPSSPPQVDIVPHGNRLLIMNRQQTHLKLREECLGNQTPPNQRNPSVTGDNT